MTFPPRTRWRISAIERGDLGPTLRSLDVELVADTTAPAVVDTIEAAARRAGVRLDRVAGDDPRFGDPVGENEVAGLVVAFKALVARAGGRVEITEAELLQARTLLARVDATPEIMAVELVDGTPPDGPRFEAESEARDPRDADEPYVGLGEVDGGGA